MRSFLAWLFPYPGLRQCVVCRERFPKERMLYDDGAFAWFCCDEHFRHWNEGAYW